MNIIISSYRCKIKYQSVASTHMPEERTINAFWG